MQGGFYPALHAFLPKNGMMEIVPFFEFLGKTALPIDTAAIKSYTKTNDAKQLF